MSVEDGAGRIDRLEGQVANGSSLRTRVAAQVVQPRDKHADRDGIGAVRRNIKTCVVLITPVAPGELKLDLLDVRNAVEAATDRVSETDVLARCARGRPNIKAAAHHAAASRIVVECSTGRG